MLRVKPGVESMTDKDGAAILDATTGVLSTLNPTGAYVWRALSNGAALGDIVRGLAAETGESHAVIEQDVHKFIDQLQSEGLVQG